MKQHLGSVVLSIAFTAALAADADVVRAPYIEVGDCWSYRGKGLYNHGWIEDYELCVTFADRAKDAILATATVKPDGRELDLAYTLDWGDVVSIEGTIAKPPARFLRFPLRVGDRYSVDFEYRSAVNAHAPGTRSFQVEVVGWEAVQVPAGKFHALKVLARGYSRPPFGYVTDLQLLDTRWYVPEVGRYVKRSLETRLNFASEELTGYRLNK